MAADGTNTFSMGDHTFSVPRELFALNRSRLRDRLREAAPHGVVVLQGGKDSPIHDTDVNFVFQQESYFFWMFGVEVPDFYGALDIATGRSFLFAPEVDEQYAIYMGELPTNDQLKEKYGVDMVFYISEIENCLKHLEPELILTLSGVNSDSGLSAKEAVFDGIGKFKVDNKILYPEITECKLLYQLRKTILDDAFQS